MSKRAKELKIIQATYREWVRSNPDWEDDDNPSVESELKLIAMTQTALEKIKPE